MSSVRGRMLSVNPEPEIGRAARTTDAWRAAGGTGERVVREPLTGRVTSERWQRGRSGPVGEPHDPDPRGGGPLTAERDRNRSAPQAAIGRGRLTGGGWTRATRR